jgi:YggT family protein
MNNPFYALIRLVSFALTILTYAIIARAVLSWIRPDPRNFFVQLINKATDPILRPLERLIPSLGGIDITPLVAILLIQVAQYFLPTLLGFTG